ncbi:MAG: DNA-binding protein [Balneola sp.]
MELPKTAFLCSRKISAQSVLKCYDWAIEQREAGNCVISGFHSPIEKDVFKYLSKGSQPIILALPRGLKKRLEPEIKQLLDQNRLLIVTPFDQSVTRVTKETSWKRNELMLELADAVVVGHENPEGELAQLLAANISLKTNYLSQ